MPRTPDPKKNKTARRPAGDDQDRKFSRILYTATAGLMALILIPAIVVSQNKENRQGPGKVNPSAAAPQGAFPSGDKLAFGIPYGSNPDAPVLELWEDFQCPSCRAVEEIAGKKLRALADAGQILLVYRMANFLDINLRNDSSTRAAIAFGCAVDQGVGADYHDKVYFNQPMQEGLGYTDAQLEALARGIGIKDEALTEWQSCVSNRTYKDWVANSQNEFNENGHTGTPTAVLAGKKIDNGTLVDPKKLADAIAAVTTK